MIELPFETISKRLRETELPPLHCVVGVLSGGLVPACLLAHQLGLPLLLISIQYRDDGNRPLYPRPKVLNPSPTVPRGKKILLVDDVSVSGKTLSTAAKHFPGCALTTLVLKGRADLVIFPEIDDCVNWPWKTRDVLF